MTSVEVLSAQELHDVRRFRFLRMHRFTCVCTDRELREEHGGLECASCGSPIVRCAYQPRSQTTG